MTAESKKKWIFIVNPIAGNGFAKSLIPEIRDKMNKYNIDGEIILTEKKGHASQISSLYYSKGFRYFIGVGGDGTVNEIARPLINKPDVIMGVIPGGTGNDFIQITGFPDRFRDDDWETFFTGNAVLTDAGKVNEMIFLNGMGLGFDAQVAAENYAGEGEVKRGGKHKYLWHIIKTILFFREKRMKVKSGANFFETDCFINTIAIGRRFAGGFFLTPGAIANDGLLDICSIKKLNLLQRFRLFLKVPSGKHIHDKKVSYYRSAQLEIKFPSKVPYHVDGELNFSGEFMVSIIPEAIRVIYNPAGNHYFSIDVAK
jgi:YegS/Rv2252/BmrU family lipid kinase